MLRGLVSAVCVVGLGLAGCGDDGPFLSDTSPPGACALGEDLDEDRIADRDEGEGDADGDGRPNARDPDSDGDLLPDALEAGDLDCATPPVDTDEDGTPDFLDLDANGDGVPDVEQREGDLDGDGILDALDPDVDGDGLPNVLERGSDGPPVDSDGDGTPDVFDLDSDADTVADWDEGRVDTDDDGALNFRDVDADGDGVSDAEEAGDADLETPPVACSNEVDPTSGVRASDGFADFLDTDSDNDGASDADELRFGTARCDPDTDGDGFGDLVEIARERINCARGVACGCATDAGCGIPEEDFFVVLPFGAPAQAHDLAFSTAVRVADVFFLVDTTSSMDAELQRVKRTVTRSDTGLMDRLRETIPEAYVGGGQHEDFPFGSYGGSGDVPFRLTIGMSAPERRDSVQAAFDGINLRGGGDGPESVSEALFQIATGAGGSWRFGTTRSFTMPRYVGDCLGRGWGAACFREGTLPVVVHFGDFCSHEGPSGESATCTDYEGIAPAPSTWDAAVEAMRARGMRYVGINTDVGSGCERNLGPEGGTPCFFMRRTAEATGAIYGAGAPLVFDLPDGGASDEDFVQTVVGALQTLARESRFDVEVGVRDDRSDDVDARLFVVGRTPGCRASPPTEPCWTPPEGREDAVRGLDEARFEGVLPGARVVFRITFANTSVPAGLESRVFVAFLQVRSGAVVLEERQVFVVVPASPGGPLE